MGLARTRKFVFAADGASNFTAPNTLKNGGIAVIESAVALTGTITLQRKDPDGNWIDVTDNTGTVTTFTKVGTYTINPQNVPAPYRLNAKSGAVTAGFPVTMYLEGR